MFTINTSSPAPKRRKAARETVADDALALSDLAYAPLVVRWILRAMIPLKAHRGILDPTMINEDDVLRAIGCGDLCDKERDGKYKHGPALRQLKALHDTLEQDKIKPPGKSCLERNLKWFAKRLGLDAVELDILRLLVLIKDCTPLADALNHIVRLRRLDLIRTLSVLLQHPEARIAECLRPERPLLAGGVVTFIHESRLRFCEKIELIDGIGEELFTEYSDPLLMIRNQVVVAPAPQLQLDDYPHLGEEIELIQQYLKSAAGRPGTNILIFGPPGTGKTELVRALSAAQGLTLFEVASKDNEGAPLDSDARLSAYRLAQMLLRNEVQTALLFDEVEDVLPCGADDFWGRPKRHANGKKGWFNQMLESNPTPAFWLSNAIDSIDAALLRRFDMVLPLMPPPRSVRTQIITRYFAGMDVRPAWIEHLAEHPRLAPAVVARTAKVAKALDLPADALERAATKLLNGTLEAMDIKPVRIPHAGVDLPYRAECLNTDPSLEQVAAQLQRHPQARLCLYGPPGTGKTAYGRHLAQAIDRPLLVKRASDLLDCYLGNTEKKIAAMFAEAEREKAVLLLDEADSFLQGRDKATRSWEVTQVNEMLTQMEQFDGIFVASTNLMDSLDEATLRRFDLKVRFRWLSQKQVALLFDDLARALGMEPDPECVAQACQLGTLAPGDFANVHRQSRIHTLSSASDIVAALQREVKARPRLGQSGGIGFQAIRL